MSTPSNSITVPMTAEDRELIKQMQTAMARQPAESKLDSIFLHSMQHGMDPELRELARNAKQVNSLESQFLGFQYCQYVPQSKYPSNVPQADCPAPPITHSFLKKFLEEYSRRLNAMAILEAHASALPWSGRCPKTSPSTTSNRALAEQELVERLPFSQEEVQAVWQFLATDRSGNGLGPVRLGSWVSATAHQLLDRVLGETAEKLRFERWVARRPETSVNPMDRIEFSARWNRLPRVDELQAIIELEQASALSRLANLESSGKDMLVSTPTLTTKSVASPELKASARVSKPLSSGEAAPKERKWEVALRKMRGHFRHRTLPLTIRQTAKIIDEIYDTTRRAAMKSPALCEHFKLETSATQRSDRIAELRQVPGAARMFDALSREQDIAAKKWIRQLSSKEYLALYVAVEVDPNKVQLHMAQYIDNADSQSRERSDCIA